MKHPALRTLDYLAALIGTNFKAHNGNLRQTLLLGFFMFAQNLLFFGMWIVFFGSVKEIKGWDIKDVSVMFGLMALTCGTVLFTADGVRSIPLHIQNGSIDGYLSRPRHPLPGLIFSRTSPAGLGDILSGPFYWLVLGGVGLSQLPVLFGLAFVCALFFLATSVIFFSLGFWLPRSNRLSEQLFEIMLILGSIPQQAQSLGVRIMLFTVLPAGFINFLPLSLFHDFSPLRLALFLGGTAFYGALALWVFNAGVRRYIAAQE